MTIVGLIGGVASGKSAVASQFVDLGATVIDADKLGHAVLTDTCVVQQLCQRWGDGIIDGAGRVRRSEVANRVFSDRDELLFLESVTHPRIGRLIEQQIEEIRQLCVRDQNRRVVMLDAPVLIKAGWADHCDVILFVEASLKTRKNRALQRGWTGEEFERRENSQISIEEKRRRSDIVIDNDGGLEQTCDQVLKVWNSLSV